MLKAFWEWRFIIVAAIAAVIYGIAEWQKAKAVFYALMLQAKRMAKDAILDSGRQQEDWVVQKAIRFMPPLCTIFLDEDTIRIIVKRLFIKLKDYMDDGQINDSQ